MRRVVSLLYRQAVKAKAEGLFFKVRLGCFLASLILFCGLADGGRVTSGIHVGPLQVDPSRSEVLSS